MAAFVCLVHYHEIGLKGNNRSTFEHKLIDNLRATLKGLPVSSVERISGHLLVRLAPAADYDAAMTVYGRIRQTPGVARVSFARCCEVSSEQYCEAAYLELATSGDFESFKVDSRRSNTHIALNSLDLNREVGSYLCERFPDKVVRMKGQDRTVHVYVIQGSVYVYVKTDEGVGGLPVGSAGKVISLLSSGIDSPVASWRMLRRGAIVVGLHFSGRPQTSDTSEWLVQDIIEKKNDAPAKITQNATEKIRSISKTDDKEKFFVSMEKDGKMQLAEYTLADIQKRNFSQPTRSFASDSRVSLPSQTIVTYQKEKLILTNGTKLDRWEIRNNPSYEIQPRKK